MTWFNVSEHPAPKNRAIEVTNGFAWHFKDTFHPKDVRFKRMSDTTDRRWNLIGEIIIVIWLEESNDFVTASEFNLVPKFKFWRELDNPLVDENLYTQAEFPAGTAYETFDGFASRAELQKKIEAEYRFLEKDISQSIRNKVKAGIKKLENQLETSYDAPLPKKKEI